MDVVNICKEGSEHSVSDTFTFYSDPSKTKRELKKKFSAPSDQAAIDKFYYYAWLAKLLVAPWYLVKTIVSVDLRRTLFDSFLAQPLKKVAGMATNEKLRTWTDNEELIGLLSYISASSGLGPSESSFLATAMHTTTRTHGTFYPKGGPSAISMSACEVVRRNGGQVLTQSKVERFLFDDEVDMGKHATKKRSGRCWGVVVNGHEVYSVRVVSDAGIRTRCERESREATS